MVIADFNMRILLYVRSDKHYAYAIGYGPTQIEVQRIDLFRTMDGKVAPHFDRCYSQIENVSAGDLARKFLNNAYFPITAEAADILRHALWLEETVEWLQYRHARRSPEDALARARRIVKRARREAKKECRLQ